MVGKDGKEGREWDGSHPANPFAAPGKSLIKLFSGRTAVTFYMLTWFTQVTINAFWGFMSSKL